MRNIVNNTVFLEMQEYAYVMQYAETLIRHLEADITNTVNDVEKMERIKSVRFIRNTAFAGLLRCGLDYTLDGNDNNKTAKLMLDNIVYVCPIVELIKILGEDAKDILGEKIVNEMVTFIEAENTNIDLDAEEENKAPENLKAKNFEVNNEKVDNKEELFDEPETIMETDNDAKKNIENGSESPEIEQPVELIDESAPEIKEEKASIPVVHELPFMNKPQKEKVDNSFVYEKLSVKACDTEKTYMIMPLKVYENEPRPQFILFELTSNGLIWHENNENGQVEFGIGSVNLIAKTSFINGRFKVSIMEENGDNRLFKVRLLERAYCHDQRVGYGHVCYQVGNEFIHIMPLSKKNDETGNAEVAIFVTGVNGKMICQPQKNVAATCVKVDDAEKEILCYWKDKVLTSEVL